MRKQEFILVFATLLLAGGIALALAADVLTVAVFDVESKDEAKPAPRFASA